MNVRLPPSFSTRFLSHRVAVLALILIAFGFRIFFVERLPYDYDRSYAHGVGLTILHQLSHGLAPTALLHSESSNSGLTNPTLTNYVFALIGLFDRSPYTATLITASLGAVVAAITYDLGRKLFGRTVGLIALAIVATSPWSAFFARGAWYTGFFELSAIVPAWLLIKALLHKTPSTKAVAIAILSGAVLAHFYLVSFALVAQVAAVLFVARTQLQAKAKLLLLFSVAWLISFAFIGVVVAANRSTNIRPDGLSLVYGNPSQQEQDKQASPGINLVTLSRFGSLISGRWEGWLGYIHDTTQAALRDKNQFASSEGWLSPYRARALAIEAAAVIGFALWLIQARTRRIIRIILVWLLVPVLGQIVVTSLLPTFPANHQNLFLASPISYLMAACGFAAVFGLLQKLLGALGALRAMHLGIIGLSAITCVPIVGWMADAAAMQSPKPIPPADAMPLLWQLRLGDAVRSHCTQLNAPENPFELSRLKMQYWAASLMQDASRVRANADVHVANADAWQVSAQGGDCAIRMSNETSPPFAQSVEITSPELIGRVQLYKAVPPPAASENAVTAGIGWRLVSIEYPARIRRGQAITVSLRWMIERLPDEPFATWRYDPFIKLISPVATEAQSIAQGDTPSVAGSAWVVGDYIQTATRFNIPAETKPGDYTLQISLFDRTQSKNAAFFETGSSASSASFDRVLSVE